jgi:hypothetical protein
MPSPSKSALHPPSASTSRPSPQARLPVSSPSIPASALQHTDLHSNALDHTQVMQLQRTIGNRAVQRLMNKGSRDITAESHTATVVPIVQRQAITDARFGAISIASSNDRLEATIDVVLADGSKAVYTLNTSYKKHMAGSYTSGTNEITAAAAPINTIAKLDADGFQNAFKDYAFLIAKKLTGSDTATFQPNALANKLTTKGGVSFWSDQAALGAEVHCFPVALAGDANAFELTAQQFNDLKLVTNLAFFGSGNLNPGARTQASQAMTRLETAVPIVALFPALHIAFLKRKIKALIKASIENDAAERAVKRETGILKGKVARGDVTPVTSLIGGKPLG